MVGTEVKISGSESARASDIGADFHDYLNQAARLPRTSVSLYSQSERRRWLESLRAYCERAVPARSPVTVIWEVVFIGVLVLANGFFAAAELAIVASSRHRLRAMKDQGNRSAGSALELVQQPERVLATVQVGITLVGTFAAAFGGATIVHALEQGLENVSWLATYRSMISLTLFTLAITVVQVVIGELIPKRIALANPTRLACFVAPVLHFLQRAAMPVVWLINRVSDLALTILGIGTGPDDSKVDLQEIGHLLEIAARQGVLDPIEQQVAMEAMHLGDQTVRQVMTPRHEIDAADIETPSEEMLGVVLMSGFSRLPVYAGDLDHIKGFVRVRDAVLQNYLGRPIDVNKLLRPVYFVPESLRLDRLLVDFRKRKTNFAVVVDEHGRTLGLVTQDDVLGELVGEIMAPAAPEPNISPRPEGGWFVDGRTPIAEMLEALGRPRTDTPRRIHTAAGLVLDRVGHLPNVGESAEWQGLRLEVVDMDGRRIDKLLVTLAGKP